MGPSTENDEKVLVSSFSYFMNREFIYNYFNVLYSEPLVLVLTIVLYTLTRTASESL